ncbi:MAG: ATP-dependent DNA helicase [Thioalkalivibrionaceae bacterium]
MGRDDAAATISPGADEDGSSEPSIESVAETPEGRRVLRWLSDDGVLAKRLAGFRPRSPQLDMAMAVLASALELRQHRLIEAPTGVGKTFGYLIPVLAARRRALIATGTRQLQDQLFDVDLPMLLESLRGELPRAIKVARLKGRANYLCHERLEQLSQELAADPGSHGLRQLIRKLEAFSATDLDGDLSRSNLLRNAPPGFGERVTSTIENCLGAECGYFEDQCFVARARRQALAADIVVVNHHLLLADLALKEQGFAELLPSTEVIVVDEAHRLPDLAGQYFGDHLSTRSLRVWVADARRTARQLATSVPVIDPLCATVERAVDALLAVWPKEPLRDARARHVAAVVVADAATDCPDEVKKEALGPVAVAVNAPDTEQFDAAASPEMRARAQALSSLDRCLADAEKSLRSLVAAHSEWRTLLDQLLEQRTALARFQAPDDAHEVSWFERSGSHLGAALLLHRTPIDAAGPLAEARKRLAASWIMVSATLAVGEDFRLIRGRFGLPRGTPAEVLPSVFDHARQAGLLLAPTDLPKPGEAGFTRAWLRWLWPLLRDMPGGAFLLFTSHRALQEAATLLLEHAPEDREVLVQSTGVSRAALVERFRAHGRAWLLGAGSFWEGVNVPGSALSLVVIDKLPFASPDDPVLAARADQLRDRGGLFPHWVLPNAILSLKQGVGRLIRSHNDRGVIVLCDPRLRTQGYGKAILAAMPPMAMLESPRAALAFLQQGDMDDDTAEMGVGCSCDGDDPRGAATAGVSVGQGGQRQAPRLRFNDRIIAVDLDRTDSDPAERR